MNCRDWEERIALYPGGDLEPAEASRVERHLAECSGCQVLASGLKEMMQTLAASHRELPPEASFSAVRAGVLALLERRPFWTQWWVYALAGAAAAVFAIFAVGIRVEEAHLPPPPPPVATMRLPGVPPDVLRPAAKKNRPPRRIVRQVAEAPARGSAPSEPVLVRMMSDNPDVVILWIADSKGAL